MIKEKTPKTGNVPGKPASLRPAGQEAGQHIRYSKHMTADLKIRLRYRGRPRIDGEGGWMKPLQRDFLCFIFLHLPKAATAKDQPCEMNPDAWLRATSIPRE